MRPLMQSLVNAIEKLKTAANLKQIQRQNYFAEQVFEAFYNIGVSGPQLTTDETVIVEPNLKLILPQLEDCLFGLALEFDPDRGRYNLILRSGIQFLIDHLSKTSIDIATVSSLKESENLKEFDEELLRWRDNPTVSWETVSHSAEDLRRPEDIPASHTWWPQESIQEKMSNEWREKAEKSQLDFANKFSDRIWDKFSLPDQEQDLWKKIAYAIAGPPPNENFEYPQDKKDQIEDIKAKCIDHSIKQGFNDVCISFLLVHAYKDDKTQDVFPLIRLRRSDGRILTDSYFIDHTGRVYENWKDFLDTNIFNGWWICVPEDAEYSLNEDETVNLTFSDQTKRGKVLEHVDRAEIINVCNEILEKAAFTPLDVLQLATKIFFFTHSAVNFKTASAIIQNTQNEVIAANRNALNSDNHAAFDAIQKGHLDMVDPVRVRVMHGNQEFMRHLKEIGNKDEFFKALEVVKGNQLNVNKELVIDPKAFLQLSEQERLDILKHSNDLQNCKITEGEFNKNVSSISREYRITFERQREQALSKIKKAFHVASVEDIEIGGKQIFCNLEPKDIDRLNQVLTDAGKNYDRDRLSVARTMADKVGCEDVTDFAAVAEFAIRKTDGEAESMKASDRDGTSKPLKPRGLKDTYYFFNQAAEKFLNNAEGFQDKVLKEFRSLRDICDKANSAGNPRFKTAAAATNHYDKHSYFPRIDENNPVPPERYFKIAREMCGLLKNPKWTQDGNSLWCKFESDEYGAIAIRYDNLLYGTSVIATLMKDDKPIGKPQLRP